MKTIDNWHDLRGYGINMLTGEACAVGTRLLCDVNEKGRQAICEILGLPHDTKLQPNWNSSVERQGDAIGAIMLPTSIFYDLSALVLLRSGCEAAVAVSGQGKVYGIEPDDNEEGEEPVVDRLRRWHEGKVRVYQPLSSQPRRGLSSVHAMSGRSA